MMNQATVKISDETHKKIRLICMATGVKQKDFVDQAIRNEINNYLRMVKRLRDDDENQMRL